MQAPWIPARGRGPEARDSAMPSSVAPIANICKEETIASAEYRTPYGSKRTDVRRLLGVPRLNNPRDTWEGTRGAPDPDYSRDLRY